MGRPVAIVGFGQTKHGRREDVNYFELVYEAVRATLEDAGISPEDVEAVVHSTMPSAMEGINAAHLYLSDAMQAFGKPLMRYLWEHRDVRRPFRVLSCSLRAFRCRNGSWLREDV
jgi:acetyl-CoA C-acetyltransferase